VHAKIRGTRSNRIESVDFPFRATFFAGWLPWLRPLTAEVRDGKTGKDVTFAPGESHENDIAFPAKAWCNMPVTRQEV
jgi:hypothetical protein